MSNWDEVADFVIVGSGGGSMCAALACIDMGLKPLILEKEPLVGGSTAMSGGIIWVPGNSLMRAAGVEDTPELGLEYLEGLVPEQPGSTLARKNAYVETGPGMIDWLRSKGIPMVYCDGWPDYYDFWQDGQLKDGVSSYGVGFSVSLFGLPMHWDFAKRWDFKQTQPDTYSAFWIGFRY